jgi:hypothetical protein
MLQLIELDIAADGIFCDPDIAAAIAAAGQADRAEKLMRLSGLIRQAVKTLVPETAALDGRPLAA